MMTRCREKSGSIVALACNSFGRSHQIGIPENVNEDPRLTNCAFNMTFSLCWCWSISPITSLFMDIIWWDWLSVNDVTWLRGRWRLNQKFFFVVGWKGEGQGVFLWWIQTNVSQTRNFSKAVLLNSFLCNLEWFSLQKEPNSIFFINECHQHQYISIEHVMAIWKLLNCNANFFCRSKLVGIEYFPLFH